MLNVMRESFQNRTWARWLKIGVLLVVALSMVWYLGAGFDGDDARQGAWIARIDGQDVPIAEYHTAGRNLEQRYQAMFGQQFDQIRLNLDLERLALNQVIARHLMLREARELGLRVDDAELARVIRERPELKDPTTGQFVGRERYLEAMGRSYPGGAPAFEAAVADDLLLQKWQKLVTEASDVPDAELERAWRQRNEKAQLDYVVVPTGEQSFSTAASATEIEGWYRAHQDDYRRGEGRKIRYVVVDRNAQATKAAPTEADVRAFFEANGAEFAIPEQRRASQILFRLGREASPAQVDAARVRAQAALDRAAAGEDFATLARTLSEDEATKAQGGDLGWFGKDDMVPAVWNTSSRTPPGQRGILTRSELGWHVLLVTGSRDAGVRPFEEVREDIRRQLQIRQAQERVRTESDRIAKAVGGSADKLEAVARQEGLTVEAKTVARGDLMAGLGPSPEFLQQVFAAPAGSVVGPVAVAQGMAIVHVESSVPASVAPLAEVRDRVRTDLLNARGRQAAVAAARAALARAGNVQGVARAMKLDVKGSGDLKPGTVLPGVGGVSPELDRSVFEAGTKKGDTGVVEVPAGALVYAVTSYQPFDAAAFQAGRVALAQELREQRRSILLDGILTKLHEKHEVEVNEQMFTPRPGPA